MIRSVARRVPSATRSRAFSQLSQASANRGPAADTDHYDVVVVGGGIVGSAVAAQLKTQPIFHGKRVAVLEPSPAPEAPGNVSEASPDLRVFSITPSSQQLLQDIKVWDRIDKSHIASFKDMQVWDAMGDGHIRFDSSKVGRSELGYTLEHKVLVHALYDRLLELSTSSSDPSPLKLLWPGKLKNFERPSEVSGFSKLTLEDGSKLSAELVIAADGGNSVVRSLSALGTWGWDYDQQAVVANVKTDQATHTAWQRFFPTGPLALLPMRDGYSSIVWSCTAEMAEELKSLSDDEFLERLQQALLSPSSAAPPSFPGLPLWKELAEGLHNAAGMVMSATSLSDPFVAPPKPIEVSSGRASFPLKMRHATQYVKPGVALVGDSAHTIHPLAGQGLNLGFADVKALGDVLSEGVKGGEMLGSEHFLAKYEQDRQRANVTMAMAMDGFKRLFGPNPDPVGVARNVGMSTLNAVEPLKHQIMRYAMGL